MPYISWCGKSRAMLNKLVPLSVRQQEVFYVVHIPINIDRLLFLLLGKIPFFDAGMYGFGDASRPGGYEMRHDGICGYSPLCAGMYCSYLRCFFFLFWNQLQLLLSAFSPACKGSVSQRKKTRLYIIITCGQYSLNYVQFPPTYLPCHLHGILLASRNGNCLSLGEFST